MIAFRVRVFVRSDLLPPLPLDVQQRLQLADFTLEGVIALAATP